MKPYICGENAIYIVDCGEEPDCPQSDANTESEVTE